MRLDRDEWARRLADRMERERSHARQVARNAKQAERRGPLPLSLAGWGVGAILAAAALSPMLSAIVSYVAR